MILNSPRSICQYSNMAPRLSGQNSNFLIFVCLSIPKRDLDTKKTTPNMEELKERRSPPFQRLKRV